MADPPPPKWVTYIIYGWPLTNKNLYQLPSWKCSIKALTKCKTFLQWSQYYWFCPKLHILSHFWPICGRNSSISEFQVHFILSDGSVNNTQNPGFRFWKIVFLSPSMIFPSKLFELADQPIGGPSSSEGKIMQRQFSKLWRYYIM